MSRSQKFGIRPAAVGALGLVLLCCAALGGDPQVYFSPHGGCTEAVVRAVAGAKKSIRVQAYSFTSAPIAAALIAAKGRGVDVRILLDAGQETDARSAAWEVSRAGIPVAIDDKHPIAHNKVMILDGETVITGSFNFTKSAESNAENLLVFPPDRALAKIYADNWEHHSQHCHPYHHHRAAARGGAGK